MERAEPVPELEQLLVVDREQRAFQRREHRQLVVGPLDRGERGADRLDLLAAVKRLAADEQVRNAARLDGVDVRARHVLAEADEPPEQHRDVPRLNRHPHARCRPRRVRPPASRSVVDQPGDERADRVGQRFLDRPRRRLQRTAAARTASGTGSATIAGWRSSSRLGWRERRCSRPAASARRRSSRRERRVHETLDRRHAAVARRQLQHAAAARELPAHAPVGRRRRCRGTGRSPASDRRR